MSISTLTSKGQITLPIALREHLHLKQGDSVAFKQNANGTWELSVPRSITPELKGMLSAYRKAPPTPAEWKQLVSRRYQKKMAP
jgi:antitoxin PrlF